MNIVILLGFQILIATEPLLCCWRSNKPCVKKSVPLPLTSLEKHKNDYRQSLQKWGQPAPSLTYRVPSLNCTLCGRRNMEEWAQRIIHGKTIPDTFYPWQVYIESGLSSCGGVLIAPRWVLTAAHCIHGRADTIMGTSNLVNYSSHAVIRGSVKEIIHDNYPASTSFDIALIKLTRPVKYNSHIRPICLPRNIIDVNESHECYVTGWGLTGSGKNSTGAEQLQEVKVQIMSHTECFARWRLTGTEITQAQVCTKLNKVVPGSGACSGDSGGPLSCRVGSRFYLAGIASMVEMNCEKIVVPDLFVKASYHREWIIRTMLANGGI